MMNKAILAMNKKLLIVLSLASYHEPLSLPPESQLPLSLPPESQLPLSLPQSQLPLSLPELLLQSQLPLSLLSPQFHPPPSLSELPLHGQFQPLSLAEESPASEELLGKEETKF
jgi:hypothetical protein